MASTSSPGTQCLKDSSLPASYAANVYYCTDPTQSACCQQNGQFTCCTPATTTTWHNQVIIFGGCFGFILLVLGCWLWYRKDVDCCHSQEHCLVKCVPCCHALCCPRDAKSRPPDSVHVPIQTPYTTLYEQSSFSGAPLPGPSHTSAGNEPPSKAKTWNEKNDKFKEDWLRSQSGNTGGDHEAPYENSIG